jgi:ABC-type transport system involved in cytochrome bd biosynthesis fused ATPase/permease subunit
MAATAAPVADTPVPPSNMTKLEGTGLQKRFGGITAISSLDIKLTSGRITGLVGPNGAGKTTAFNVLTGFLQADEGEIRYKGDLLRNMRPTSWYAPALRVRSRTCVCSLACPCWKMSWSHCHAKAATDC